MPLTQIDYQTLSHHIGYTFQAEELLFKALCHRSVGSHNNERLEFLGDTVLNTVISHYLWKKFPHADEGYLSRLRAKMVCGAHLQQIAERLNLSPFIQLGDSEKTAPQQASSILADTLEALIGAIYLEAGYDTTSTLICSWFGHALDGLQLADGAKDPKTSLQEYMQSRHLPLPEYEVVAIQGPAHQQAFQVKCKGIRWEDTTGHGASRRKAEQDAAAKVLAGLV